MSQGATSFMGMEITLSLLLFSALVIVVAVVVGLRVGRTSNTAGDAGEVARMGVLLQEREREVQQVRGERDTARQERDDARHKLAEANENLAAEKAEHKARSEELNKYQTQLENQFKGLASGVLKENSESLLKQAKELFDGQSRLSASELEKRQKAIDNMVKPINEKLGELDKQNRSIEAKREGAYKGLQEQVASLMRQGAGLQKVTGDLREALRSPQIRGRWAEQELSNILELAGISQHISYHLQASVEGPDGTLRPDAVVDVPGGAKVVIDAKAPLENFLNAHEADDETKKKHHLDLHVKSISGHAKSLGGRDYAAAVKGSPDFVLMFVPADPILESAMKVAPRLWENAWKDHNVLIATPGLLVAFLRTVALAWKQQEMSENAAEIAKHGKELYERLRVFVEHFQKVGTGLERAVSAYNDGVGSFEKRVLPKARRFGDLGVASDSKQIPELEQVETSVRSITTETYQIPEAQDAHSSQDDHGKEFASNADNPKKPSAESQPEPAVDALVASNAGNRKKPNESKD